MAIKTVLLIGAGGSLGTPTLQELQKSFTVTVLTRESSTTTYPSTVRVITVPESYPESDLEAAFADQDAVVSTITTTSTSVQKRFVDAAIKAGVKRFIPGEFGSDTENDENLAMAPGVWGPKRELLDYLKAKANSEAGSGGLTWTAIGNGMFFDWAFLVTKGHSLQLDLDKKTALVLDDGDRKFSVTNLAQVARAVVRVLQHEAETRNKFLFVQSFCKSQNELVAALEKVTGSKFEVSRESSEKWFEENVAKSQKEGDQGAMWNVMFGICVTNSDWTKDERFANGILGLEEEDLEESLRAALKKM